MCGIFGYLGPETVGLDNKTVLSHRGPDQFGRRTETVGDTRISFSHNRLSIIGLGEQGRQPFVSDDGQVMLIYNGEIYNYQSLRKELRGEHGREFQSNTDTEVLLAAYQQWGLTETLSRINGIFAFGLADLDAEQAFVVRDHLGTKPVYYAETDNGIVFASEAKAIFDATDLEPRLREDIVGEYLANFWVQEPDTLFRDVYKLESAHYLTVNLPERSITKTEYWDVLDDSPECDVDKLGAEIDEVVKEQLVSDVPVGLYLSGGIDSSIVAYHASSRQDGITALNLKNPEDKISEHEVLRKLEAELPIDLDLFSPSADMLEIYKEMVYHLDEPVADPAIIPAHLLAREASDRDIRVMLSGMGGDELFAGYRRMRVISQLSRLEPLSGLIDIFASVYPRSGSFRRNIRRVANFLKDPTPANYFSLTYYFDKDEISQLVGSDDWYDRYSEKIDALLADKTFVDDAQRYQYLDLKGYLSSHNLMYIDKASMAASVEVRVPLLDRRLTKYFNLPTAEKTADGPKTPLKAHLRTILGDEFVASNKQGFSFPIEELLQSNQLQVEFDRLLNDERLATVIDVNVVEQMLADYEAGRADNAMKLWAVYTLWLWLNAFDVKTEAAPRAVADN